jgi:hypothetical protein
VKTGLLYGTLALRVAFAWWILLVAASALFSGLLAGLGALLIYPPLTLALGGLAAWLHHRGLAAASAGASPLAIGQRQSISLPLPANEALRVARGAINAVFGQDDQRITDDTITTRVIERGHRPTGLAALRSDQLTLVAAEDGPGHSVLQVTCEPTHAWLYRLFWVDTGRCAREVEALRRSLLARVRAQGDVANALARQSDLQSRLDQTELLLLRAQIEPHFLFNTLAHIRASLGSHPHTAEAMLDALIGFLHANSRTVSTASISLEGELQRVVSYLTIMQMRLGERLRYSVDCEPALFALQVPTACVLILAENAVKHGIERSDAPGRIAVSCQQDTEVLQIDVENDGPGLAMRHDGGGLGLNNLRRRLRLAYGDGAQMNVEDRDEGGVRASLRMPVGGHAHDG